MIQKHIDTELNETNRVSDLLSQININKMICTRQGQKVKCNVAGQADRRLD